MHISITGDLGSGKSTVAKELSKILGYRFISTGEMQRELGLLKGMDTLEFNKYTDNNKDIDDYIDQHLKDINIGNEYYILDSRLAWFFVSKSFKVYLMTLDVIAANRILLDKDRIGEPNADSVKKKIIDSKERRLSENNRFQKLYGIVPKFLRDFDLIIDTSHISVEKVISLILDAYNRWKEKKDFVKLWISPLRIYPCENIRIIASQEAKEVKNSIISKGFNENYPLLLIKVDNYYFVYDGHKRWSASLYIKCGIVPAIVIAENDQEILKALSASKYITDSFNLSCIYDWEDAHSFRYTEYPNIRSKVN